MSESFVSDYLHGGKRKKSKNPEKAPSSQDIVDEQLAYLDEKGFALSETARNKFIRQIIRFLKKKNSAIEAKKIDLEKQQVLVEAQSDANKEIAKIQEAVIAKKNESVDKIIEVETTAPSKKKSSWFSMFSGSKKKDESSDDAGSDSKDNDEKPSKKSKKSKSDDPADEPDDTESRPKKKKRRISKKGTIAFFKRHGKKILIILALCVIAVIVYFIVKATTKKFTNKESMLTTESNDTYQFKATDNRGTGLALSRTADNKVSALPDNTESAKVWVYNKKDYSICSSTGGLCLKKGKDSEIEIKPLDKTNDFKWYLDLNYGKIVNIEDDIVVANVNGTKVVASKKQNDPSEYWKFHIV